MIKEYWTLIKGGIVALSWVCACLGYFLALGPKGEFNFVHFLMFSIGLCLLAAGSCALNQVQESDLDSSMDRTKKRPIPSGTISLERALFLSFFFISIGLGVLTFLSLMTASLGLLTVILYNGFYTLVWKRRWAFGAVPGAIPGAMPVVLGFSVVDANILRPECIYIFLILFLWQMPHFWSLAIKLKEDYKKGGVPVLPVAIGSERTVLHIGVYTFVYLAVALASPFFVNAHLFYFILVIPFVFYVLKGLVLFVSRDATESWFPFFMKVNFSLLVFLIAAVADKWTYDLFF